MKRIFSLTLVAGLMMVTVRKNLAADDSAAAVYASGANSFAVDLYKQVAGDESPNVFFSPYSIDTALLMVGQGARANTADQFGKVLHLGGDTALLEKGVADLSGVLKGDATFQLTVANGMWVEKGFPILASYMNQVKKLFGVDAVFPANFAGDPEGERKTINGWVLDHTGKKIADLLPEKSIQNNTRIVVANAIYFKAAWDEPFSKAATEDQPFHLASGKDVTVPLMRMSHSFMHGEADGLQVLSMGYRTSEQGGSNLSMVILLPAKPDGLSAIEKSLTTDSLATLLQGMTYGRVNVSLPRFKVTQALSLGDVLVKMGLTDAFTDKADFSGMVEPTTTERKIAISAVVHKAFIDVNEEGTAAAAATAVIIRAGAARVQAPPVEFRADHPFLFLIRENKTGVILFMGRVGDPTKG